MYRGRFLKLVGLRYVSRWDLLRVARLGTWMIGTLGLGAGPGEGSTRAS